MAVEKTKVINRFKALFGTIGLSNTRLDEISAKLAGKLSDDATDEQIDERINDLNEVYPFSEIKKNDDRALNDKNNPNRNNPQPKTEPKEKDEDDPIKQLLNGFKEIKSELDALKADRTSQTIGERFRKDERITGLKGLQEHMFKGRIPKTEEEYESAVTEFVEDWKPFLEKTKLGDQGGDEPANGGRTKTKEVKKISPEEAKKVVESMNN